MFKKIGTIALSLFLLFCAVEYGKHYILLSKIRDLCLEHDVVIENGWVSVDTGGFHMTGENLSGPNITIEKMRARMPILDFSSFRIRLNDLLIHGAKARRFYAIVETDNKNIDVEYYTVKDLSGTLWGKDFSTPDISGTLSYSPTRFEYTLYSESIQQDNRNLFTLASHGAVTNPTVPDNRIGKVQLRVSNVKTLLSVLEQGRVLQGWQAVLFQGALGDNVQIPFDIKGRKIFFGPVKLFNVDF